MTTINLDIAPSVLKTSVESLVWKYGVSVDTDNSAKQANNVKSDSGGRAVDSRVLDDSFSKRFEAAVDMMRDFVTGVTDVTISTDVPAKRIALSFSSRWKGTQATLLDAVTKYITDGMMVDWLNVTAPGEVQMYSVQLAGDENSIKSIIYSMGKPAIS